MPLHPLMVRRLPSMDVMRPALLGEGLHGFRVIGGSTLFSPLLFFVKECPPSLTISLLR